MIAVLEYVAHQGLMFELLSSQTVIIRVVFLAAPLIETPIRRIPPLHIALIRRIKCFSVPAVQFGTPACLNDLLDGG